MFNVNVGKWDAAVRVLIGSMLLSQVRWGFHTPWAWSGLALIATGVLRRCPLWAALGCSTAVRRHIEVHHVPEGKP